MTFIAPIFSRFEKYEDSGKLLVMQQRQRETIGHATKYQETIGHAKYQT